MSVTSIKKGRPPIAQRQVFDAIHQRIISGELGLSARLPTRRELGDTFNVGLQAVQSALETLVDDGFVVSRGTQGTFVVDDPPHLSRYGLIFEESISKDLNYPSPRFWTALSQGAERLSQRVNRPVEIFDGIWGSENASCFRRLTADVRRHRLAGLFFPSPPLHIKKSTIMLEPGMPRVVVIVEPEDLPMHRLLLDYSSFFDRGLGELKRQGCKRIAIIRSDQLDIDLDKSLRHHDLNIPAYWRHQLAISSSSSVTSLVHLMLQGDKTLRPDGLFIADDSFVEYAAAGLHDAGVRVGEELKVVAHCNFPWPVFEAMPMIRIGFDTDRMLSEAVKLIDRSRQGESDWQLVRIPAVFEDEYINSAMSSSR